MGIDLRIDVRDYVWDCLRLLCGCIQAYSGCSSAAFMQFVLRSSFMPVACGGNVGCVPFVLGSRSRSIRMIAKFWFYSVRILAIPAVSPCFSASKRSKQK